MMASEAEIRTLVITILLVYMSQMSMAKISITGDVETRAAATQRSAESTKPRDNSALDKEIKEALSGPGGSVSVWTLKSLCDTFRNRTLLPDLSAESDRLTAHPAPDSFAFSAGDMTLTISAMASLCDRPTNSSSRTLTAVHKTVLTSGIYAGVPYSQNNHHPHEAWIVNWGLPGDENYPRVELMIRVACPINAHYTCVSWDKSALAGKGAWTGENCMTSINETTCEITCQCNSTGTFAMLSSDIDGSAIKDAKNEGVHCMVAGALIAATIGLALTALFVCFARLLPQSKLRKPLTNNEFVIINLCVALGAAYVTFITGVASVDNKTVCITVGALIHYFFLVSVAWEGVEAYLLYKTFGASGGTVLRRIHNMKKTSAAICWGIPAVFVAIVLGADMYAYVGEQACWLAATGRASFFGAFMAPICAVLLWNCVVFVLVILELRKAMNVNMQFTKNRMTVQANLRRGFTLFCLLGFHWTVISMNALSTGISGQWVLRSFTVMFCGTQGISLFAIQVSGMWKEIREAYQDWQNKKRHRSFTNSSTSSTQVLSALPSSSSGRRESTLDDVSIR